MYPKTSTSCPKV